MSRHHRRKQRFKLKSFYVWHRYMGISAAVFMLIVAVTGLLLNHTEDFQFDSTHVQSDWLLDWYGIQAPENLLTFPAGDRHITLMGAHLYLNRREIKGDYSHLTGALLLDDMLVIAISNNILLLTPRGEIIERLGSKDGVPAGIRQLGIAPDGGVVSRTGHDYYQPDADFIRWTRWDSDPSQIQWAVPTELEPKLKTALRHHYRREVLPRERLILDLHSGRFFGVLGPWVFDAAAIILALLSLSGTWIWLKRRR